MSAFELALVDGGIICFLYVSAAISVYDMMWGNQTSTLPQKSQLWALLHIFILERKTTHLVENRRKKQKAQCMNQCEQHVWGTVHYQ